MPLGRGDTGSRLLSAPVAEPRGETGAGREECATPARSSASLGTARATLGRHSVNYMKQLELVVWGLLFRRVFSRGPRRNSEWELSLPARG